MGGGTGSVLQRGGFRSLLAFHAAGGARLALRAAVPAVAAIVVACGLALSPTAALREVADILAGPPGPARAALLLVAALAFASWAGARAAAGATGWSVHLPSTAAAQRRALSLAIALGQAPLLVLVGVSALALRAPASTGRLAGAGVAVVACALAVLPVRPAARGLACGAAALGAWGSWELTCAGAGVLAAADALGGRLQPPRARRLRHLPLPVPLAIALRAAGRDLPGAWMAGMLPLVAVAAFLHNNTPWALSPSVVQGAVRLGGGMAGTLVTTSLAGALGNRRPPWAWARSLPQGARARVLWDAGMLTGAALPAVAVAAWLDGRALSWAPVLAALPWLALRGAGAIRERRRGLAEGAFLSAWIALLPWLAAAIAALCPWAFRNAVRADQALSPHTWQERDHLPGADSLAWDEGGAG